MRTSARQYWNLLVRYLRPQWPRTLLLTVLLFGSIGLQLINPQIMRHFIDVATLGAGADDAAETLLKAAMLFLGVAVVQQVVSVLATYVSESVAWTATNALRADLVEHCLRLDMSFHNAHTPGEMIERVDGDVTALSNFFSRFVIQVVGNAVLLVGILILLFREDPRVGLALTGFALVTLFILARFRGIAVPHWTAERQASAELFGFLEERLSGTEDIRANGAETYVMRGFYRLMRELMRRSLRAALMINILINTSELLFALGNAVALAVGAWLFREGTLTIGTVYIIFHYTTMLRRPIGQITRQLEDLQKATAGIVRIRELLETQSRIQDLAVGLTAGLELPGGALTVEFWDVSFGYNDAMPNGAWRRIHEADSALSSGASPNGSGPQDAAAPAQKDIVLRDVSFRLQQGTVLGLLGRTGSGKTTLTRLLFRLYDPDSGAIRLGNGTGLTDIHRIPLADLRQRVGMVTQNVQLFHATVRDNLTFFDDSIADEEIWGVIRDLGLEEWIRSLPDGLDTELESGGGGLSAGESQLLAFSRIFLQDPGLVILDEASSRLDPATERLIERAVDRLVQNRTAIIIAHRLGTVQRADEIMILEDGRISEHGMRSALASDPTSRFYSLLQTGLEEVLA